MTALVVIVLVLAAAIAVLAWPTVVRVPEYAVGVVVRRAGRRSGDDDPRWTVSVSGASGPQAALLHANQVVIRPRWLLSVRFHPTTHVPAGTIGLVIARTGRPLPRHSSLAPHVECSDFQDGATFLRGGGCMGSQAAVLTPGNYSINPELFQVITVHSPEVPGVDIDKDDLQEATIPEGETGVVIALHGLSADDEADEDAVGPRIPGHMHFQLPWVFLDGGGRRGVQAETLSHGGKYQINPWFARVVTIPTRDLILEWTSRDRKAAGQYDAALDEVEVMVEGYAIRFEITQTIRIPASAAPKLVRRFGEKRRSVDGRGDPAPVRRFVERVLGSTVDGYLHGIAAEYRVNDFLDNHRQVRLELQEQVSQALSEWGVVAVRTTLSEFRIVDPRFDELRRATAAERERREAILSHGENRDLELENEKRAAEQVAVIDGIKNATEREKRKLDTVILEEELRLLGANHVAMDRFLRHLAAMNVPQFVGGQDAEAILRFLPLAAAQDAIRRATQEEPHPSAQALSGLGRTDALEPDAAQNGGSLVEEPPFDPEADAASRADPGTAGTDEV